MVYKKIFFFFKRRMVKEFVEKLIYFILKKLFYYYFIHFYTLRNKNFIFEYLNGLFFIEDTRRFNDVMND